jgi:hypothetical protein
LVSAAMALQLNYSRAAFTIGLAEPFAQIRIAHEFVDLMARSRENLSGSTGSKGLTCNCSSGTRTPVLSVDNHFFDPADSD